MSIKKILLTFRVLFYKLKRNTIKIGKNLNIHPSVKLVTSQRASINIGDDCALAGLTIICAEDDGGVQLEDNVSLSRGVQLYSRNKITIGEGTMIGNNTLMFDHDHNYKCAGGVRANKYISTPIVIGKNVWVGCNVTILRGSTIGDNCVIGAGAVIKGNYPANSVVVQSRTEKVITYKIEGE